MKCEICNKKKATVHLTELVDDQVSELHICEDCAREKSVQMEQQFGLADLLAGLSDFGNPITGAGAGKVQEKPQVLACENCETTYEEFKKHGRLGCSECYQAFRSQLGSLLKKIHGASKHTGKLPKHVAAEAPKKEKASKPAEDGSVESLKEQLQQAVLCEDYEKAAELRDKIREMEKNQ